MLVYIYTILNHIYVDNLYIQYLLIIYGSVFRVPRQISRQSLLLISYRRDRLSRKE